MRHFSLSRRSLDRLHGVDVRLVTVIRQAITLTPLDFSVIEGLRIPERQQALYQAGKTLTLKSKDLTGHAVDVMPGGADWDQPEMWLPVLQAIRQVADDQQVRLRFGYTWTCSLADPAARFLDAPHVELAQCPD